MKRTVKRILSGVFVLLVLLVVAIFWVLRQSLPQIDGTLALPQLTADVSIERDGHGIPTISANDRLDLAFATGFVHGQDRFFQMDLTRRNAAGELSEIVGPAALPTDRRRRLHRFRNRAGLVLARLENADLALLTAYADGVNAGVENLGAKPFEYFLLGVDPAPWTPADSLLAVYSMYFELNDETAVREIGRGVAARSLPASAFAWLFPRDTRWDAPLTGDIAAADWVPTPEQYSVDAGATSVAAAVPFRWREPHAPGSNNWAIAGSLTADGRAIVANDMHLGLAVPNVFYRARMRVTGDNDIDLIGLTYPGTPILVAGSNGHVAWANTNSNGDWTDAVLLAPGMDADTYLTPAGPQAYALHQEEIRVKDGAPETLEVRETIWGPVLPSSDDIENSIAVSWIAHHPEAVTLGHVRLESAATAADALRIANTIGMPPQNFVVGDADGNIGWTIAGKIPLRPATDSTVPQDWSQHGGWRGWLDPEDYPRVLNPESGRIWTANARVVGGQDLELVGDGGYALGARGQQIRDDLFAKSQFSIDDMLDVHLDDRAVFLSRWRDLVLDVLDDAAMQERPERREFRNLVDAWVPRAAAESVGYRLVRAYRLAVGERVIPALMEPVTRRFKLTEEPVISKQFEQPLWSLVTQRPAHLLAPGYGTWRILLLDAVDGVIDEYSTAYGDQLESRTWGERNTAAIRHPLSQFIPFLSRWLDMPAEPLHGDSNMPRVQGQAFGASERFAVAPGAEEDGYLHMPAGQSGHPLSPFYAVGHDDWVHGRRSRFLPGTAAHSLTLRAER